VAFAPSLRHIAAVALVLLPGLIWAEAASKGRPPSPVEALRKHLEGVDSWFGGHAVVQYYFSRFNSDYDHPSAYLSVLEFDDSPDGRELTQPPPLTPVVLRTRALQEVLGTDGLRAIRESDAKIARLRGALTFRNLPMHRADAFLALDAAVEELRGRQKSASDERRKEIEAEIARLRDTFAAKYAHDIARTKAAFARYRDFIHEVARQRVRACALMLIAKGDAKLSAELLHRLIAKADLRVRFGVEAGAVEHARDPSFSIFVAGEPPASLKAVASGFVAHGCERATILPE
jgi:hypothetical protein